MALLGILPKISTSFYPQTDGSTERVNQVIEMFIHTFCNYEQSNWAELLPMAEYSYINSVHSATRLILSYINYGYHLHTNWPIVAEVKYPASDIYVYYLKTIQEKC
jgi:hypothetical protein